MERTELGAFRREKLCGSLFALKNVERGCGFVESLRAVKTFTMRKSVFN